MTKNDSDIPSSYISPWIRMNFEDWKPLLQNALLKSYPKDTIIYHQGEQTPYIYLVKTGRVCLDIYAENGKKRSLYIADRGTCFGELACLDHLPNYCSATTCTETSLYLIRDQEFLKETEMNHSFTLAILQSLSLKTRVITGLLEQLSFDNSQLRFYHSLIALIQQYGTRTKEGYYRLSIKFTHQEMAYQTGLSRVSISNSFLSLTNAGYIEKENGYLIIKDLDALQRYLNEENF